MRMIAGCLALCVLMTAAFASVSANAHTRSQSMSALFVEGDDVSVSFRVTAREVTRLGVLDPQAETLPTLLATHLSKSLTVARGSTSCAISGAPRPLVSTAAELRFEMIFSCASETAGQAVTFTNDAFFPIASRHIHFVRARAADGTFEERLLTATGRNASFLFSPSGIVAPIEESILQTFWRYIVLGAEHIWIGIDHLAFLVGLLLLCRRLRDVVFVVTGFTVGHSVTLSLTVLGLAVPDPPVVEALIAFTIVLVAVEAVSAPTGLPKHGIVASATVMTALAGLSWALGGAIPPIAWVGLVLLVAGYAWLTRDERTASRLLPALTLVFGLIHGFGFAGVLLELGLPTDRLALALLGFNLGVEIGQLIFIALLWGAAMVAVPRLSRSVQLGVRTSAATLLCTAGSYWFALRAFG